MLFLFDAGQFFYYFSFVRFALLMKVDISYYKRNLNILNIKVDGVNKAIGECKSVGGDKEGKWWVSERGSWRFRC